MSSANREYAVRSCWHEMHDRDERMITTMKKRAKWIAAGVAVGILAVGAVIVNKYISIQKTDDAVTIIGGSDGPTAVFFAGKLTGGESQPTQQPETPQEPEHVTEDTIEDQIEDADAKDSDEGTPASESSEDEKTAVSDPLPQADGAEQVERTDVASEFYVSEIPDDIFTKMQGKSYKADCTVPREDLRYVHVLHTGFDGETKEGELVVNKAIADDVCDIFEKLYEANYPIEKIRLVDEYDADDEASMSDNNSSAFNFRFISHTTKISRHGLGMAVDINTLYNPYVKTVDGRRSVEPANAADYVDRSVDFPYKIDHDDLCYQLFTEHGFTWGGDWNHSKDYQHFEKVE